MARSDSGSNYNENKNGKLNRLQQRFICQFALRVGSCHGKARADVHEPRHEHKGHKGGSSQGQNAQDMLNTIKTRG